MPKITRQSETMRTLVPRANQSSSVFIDSDQMRLRGDTFSGLDDLPAVLFILPPGRGRRALMRAPCNWAVAQYIRGNEATADPDCIVDDGWFRVLGLPSDYDGRTFH